MNANGFGETPLFTALTGRSDKNTARFHMPGHKGRPIAGFAFPDTTSIDFTELSDTGDLYREGGPIAQAEALNANACGARRCLFLTGGATQGVMASLACLCSEGSKVLISRASHLSVYNAVALLGLFPQYIFPEFSLNLGVSAGITRESLENKLKTDPDIRVVLISSPTYYGAVLDVKGLSQTCAGHGASLIVDGAHGAHMPFIGMNSAVTDGAAIEINSAHKTLPALGQGAWLLAGEGVDADSLRRMTAVFGTSSPSYAVMASLDLSRAYMQGRGKADYLNAVGILEQIKDEITKRGVFYLPSLSDFPACAGLDPGRLCLNTTCAGLTGFEAAKILENEYGVVCEMADRGNVVFIITCADDHGSLSRLDRAIKDLEKRVSGKPLPKAERPPLPGECAVSLRRALLSRKRSVKLADSAGLIAAECVAPYPPGLPVIAPGERIEEKHLAYLHNLSYNMNNRIQAVDSV